MNYYLTNKIIFGIILIMFVSGLFKSSVFGQNFELGNPRIYNIPPSVYGYESQNFSIAQDRLGYIYIANLSGLIEYDGSSWNLIKVPGAFALATDEDGRIFVGGYDEFGYIDDDETGVRKYHSLTNQLKGKNRFSGEVAKIMACKGEMFFYTKKNRLFRWDRNKLECIDSSNVYLRTFKVNDELYTYKYGVGLLKYSSQSFSLVIEGNFFSEKKILEILPFNDNLLIKTEDTKGFYLYSNDSISIFRTKADDFLENNRFNIGRILQNGNYALGTRRCGIVVINNKGEVLYNINLTTGLYDDDIGDIFIDRSNNMWLATNNGISRVELPDPFTYFDRSTGLIGGSKAITRHNGLLYVATTQGLYYMDPQNKLFAGCSHLNRFKVVEGIESDGNSFFAIDDKLFLSTDGGLYKIEGNKSTYLKGGLHELVIKSKKNPDIYYFCTGSGVEAMTYTNGNFSSIGNIEQITTHIRTIVEEDDGTLWLGTNYNGIFKVELAHGWDPHAKVTHIRDGLGLPNDFDWVDIYNSRNGILFSTGKGVYRFNKSVNRFYADTLLGFDFTKKEGIRWLFPIVEDLENNLLLSSGLESSFIKQTGIARFGGDGKKYELQTSPFNKLKSFTIEDIYPDSGNIVWMAAFDGLIRIDKNMLEKEEEEFTTHIRKIVIGGIDSILPLPAYANNLYLRKENILDSIIPSLSYKYNSFRVEFAAPSFKGEDPVQFSFILEGFDKTWSQWDLTSHKEYNKLQEGSYTFRVKARNNAGNESSEAVYKFEIRPPFYRTWWAYLIYFLLLGSFTLMVMKWRSYLFEKEKHKLERIIADRTEELVKQKERAEMLVSNILPKQTAEELKAVGRTSRKKYKMVTVLFSDIEGFSSISDDANSEVVLDELDRYFNRFDTVVEQLNIEKIKTIGDTYMCAGGIPQKNRTNPIDVVMAAIEMREHMADLRGSSQNDWQIKIGIHSGPVIAGIGGGKKISYDIWGDTVNIASRMEASGKIGKICISEVTHELVQNYFDCEFYRKIPVKYKGDIGMYFVKGLKRKYAEDEHGVVANQSFITKLQMIRFDDLEELIMTKLEKGLPKNLYYHNMKHTIDVLTQVELIGRKECISEEDMLLIKTAALFHDAGFLIGYDEHELLGVKLAGEILPDFYYSEEQIRIISELVYSTKIPPNPQNLLEEIICDADLDYLGRTDFLPVSQNLFRELYEHGKIKTIEDWNKLQVNFISGHQYFTKSAQELREVNKNKQLDKIKSMI